MSTEIDPRIVHEVAEAAFRSADGGSPAERIEAALIAADVAGPVLGERFDAYTKAVGAEYDRLEAEMPDRMSDERLVELLSRMKRHALSNPEANELATEIERARSREAALVNEVDERDEQLRRVSAELSRCTDLNRDLVAENANLTETAKEAREQIRDRDYVNANLRKTVEEYRARLAQAGETELEWGVRSRAGRATLRTEDFSQPSEKSARARVARSDGFSMLICRTKAGEWREVEES